MEASDMQYAVKFADGVRSRLSLRNAYRDLVLTLMSMVSLRDRQPFLRCVFCHHVFDDQVGNFERALLYLQRIGTFVSTDRCIDMVEGRVPIEGANFHLSFDDGFKNISTNAAPVLQKLQIPALFFVPTAYVDAPYERVRYFCEEVAGYARAIEIVSWDDLKRLKDQGVEIGSHTQTHKRFSDISQDPARLREELEGSKKTIEEKLGIDCRTIAWPYGQLKDANKISLEVTKSVGYQCCFGAFRGTVRSGGCDPYMIPRHHFEAHWPVAHIRYFSQGNMEQTDVQARLK